MSTSDLFTADYPHGTAKGYDDGCRAGACPGGDLWGLTCKTAKQRSRSDYEYQKLAASGLTPAEIADKLGLIPTSTTPAPVTKRAPKPKPADTQADAEPTDYTGELAPDVIAEINEAAAELVAALPTDTPDISATTTPTPKEIRAWATDRGYEVKPMGKLPQHIIDHYWETHDVGAPTTEVDTSTAEVDTETPETVTIVPEPDGPHPEWGYVSLTEDLARAQTDRDALAEELETAQGELTRARGLAARLEEELARSERTRELDRAQHAESVTMTVNLTNRILDELGADRADDPALAAHNLRANYLALAEAHDRHEQDERIKAWELVASHPAFASCYDEEIPLLTATLQRLTRLADSVHELQAANVDLAVALANANEAHAAEISALNLQAIDDHNGARRHIAQLQESLALAEGAGNADDTIADLTTRLAAAEVDLDLAAQRLDGAVAAHIADAHTIRTLSSALEFTIRQWATERERNTELLNRLSAHRIWEETSAAIKWMSANLTPLAEHAEEPRLAPDTPSHEGSGPLSLADLIRRGLANSR